MWKAFIRVLNTLLGYNSDNAFSFSVVALMEKSGDLNYLFLSNHDLLGLEFSGQVVNPL